MFNTVRWHNEYQDRERILYQYVGGYFCFAVESENKTTYSNSSMFESGDTGSDLQEETRALRHEDDPDERSQRREETHENK